MNVEISVLPSSKIEDIIEQLAPLPPETLHISAIATVIRAELHLHQIAVSWKSFSVITPDLCCRESRMTPITGFMVK